MWNQSAEWLHVLSLVIGRIHEVNGIDALDGVLDSICSLCRCPAAALFLLDSDNRGMVLKARSGFSDPRAKLEAIAPHIQSAVRSLETPLWCIAEECGNDVPDELFRGLRSIGISSFCLIPVRAAGLSVGGILLCSDAPRTCGESERDLLQIFGMEMGHVYMRDLLQRRLLEAVNRAENAREEADLYLDIMTHDLNNMNNSILGYIHLLLEGTSGEPRRYVERVAGILEQAIQTIENVSTIRRIREAKSGLRPLELDPVIKGVLKSFPDIEIEFRETGLSVMADDLLPQIFINLIGNSRKFGGEDVRIAIHAKRVEEGILITVEDTGPGINEEASLRLFQRYGKGDHVRGGKGLGLYIVRMLTERYGGSIHAERRIEGGTAVKILLKEAAPSDRSV